jgi:hypothetical protein
LDKRIYFHGSWRVASRAGLSGPPVGGLPWVEFASSVPVALFIDMIEIMACGKTRSPIFGFFLSPIAYPFALPFAARITPRQFRFLLNGLTRFLEWPHSSLFTAGRLKKTP